MDQIKLFVGSEDIRDLEEQVNKWLARGRGLMSARDFDIWLSLLFGLEFPPDLFPLAEAEIQQAGEGIAFEDGELEERLKEAKI